MDKKSKAADNSLMHDFIADANGPFMTRTFIILLAFVAVLGLVTGYGFSRGNSTHSLLPSLIKTNNSSVQTGKTYGSNDTTTFKDTAEGTVKEGGIAGEGQYHLVRPGGDSQNVYMTSSTVDLSQFLDRKIKVWGQTQEAKKAGWLMDVGRVQVLE